jgi:hypothetical protein
VSVLLAVGALSFAVVAVMQFSGRFHICADSELWTAAIITNWPGKDANGTLTLLNVTDWLDCVGGAGMSWARPPMAYDDVSVALKSLFETATFSGYSDSLMSALMGKGRGLQPAWEANTAVSVPTCAFFFLWLVLGGLVVRRHFHGSFCRAVAFHHSVEDRVSSSSRVWSLTPSRSSKQKPATPRRRLSNNCHICEPCTHLLCHCLSVGGANFEWNVSML